MNKKSRMVPAGYLGPGAGIAAAGLFFIQPLLSIIILAGFIAVCVGAAFFPQTGLLLPVVSRGRPNGRAVVALTFDDGPDPRTTPLLLALLARYKIKATFFVAGRKAEENPRLMEEIIRSGHAVGNHTYSHDVLIMLKTMKKLAGEIDSAQEAIKKSGVVPLVFRPPAGVVNPGLGPLLKKRGLICVHYSCRGFDAGNRRLGRLAEKILGKIRPGDLVLLHDVHPGTRGFKVEQWLNEMEKIMTGLSEKGLQVVPLSEIIDQPVMTRNQ